MGQVLSINKNNANTLYSLNNQPITHPHNVASWIGNQLPTYGHERILVVHTPGSGEIVNNGSIGCMRPLINAFHNRTDLPILEIPGLAGLEQQTTQGELANVGGGGYAAFLDPETGQFVTPPQSSQLLSLYFSKGFKNHAKYLINVLEHLPTDQRPLRIVMAGYSRGALQNLALANELYKRYNQQIKCDLYLHDPVIGTFQRSKASCSMVPPNVDTLFINYSANDTLPFHTPQDWQRLTRTANHTAVTTSVTSTKHNDLPFTPKRLSRNSDLLTMEWTEFIARFYQNLMHGQAQHTVALQHLVASAHQLANMVSKDGVRQNCHYKQFSDLSQTSSAYRQLHNQLRQGMYTVDAYQQLPITRVNARLERAFADPKQTNSIKKRKWLLKHAYYQYLRVTTRGEVANMTLGSFTTLGLSSTIHLTRQRQTWLGKCTQFTVGLLTLNTLSVAQQYAKIARRKTAFAHHPTKLTEQPTSYHSLQQQLDLPAQASSSQTSQKLSGQPPGDTNNHLLTSRTNNNQNQSLIIQSPRWPQASALGAINMNPLTRQAPSISLFHTNNLNETRDLELIDPDDPLGDINSSPTSSPSDNII